MYHIVGALFLSFTALVYCEGIISGFQPPFFLGQWLGWLSIFGLSPKP